MGAALRTGLREIRCRAFRRVLAVAGGKTTRLTAGDCFMVSGNAFTVASDPAIQPADAASVFAADTSCGEIGSGADVDILGGSVTFAQA
ncbi:AraC family transcriptional regulator [Croceibacterium ferulae]|uniref:AraC family transcriptional regulator n=1 Tax=Croceibacterium ferulae TaxID=1854641 RepID=UPI00139009C3|nr:AraC family transcriptional regulator [Croceibacterium ferulae]